MRERTRRPLRKRHKDMIFVACLVVLPLIQYAIFYLAVNINSYILAFQDYRIDPETYRGTYVWNNFANFSQMFREFIREGLFWTCLKNSLIYWAVSLMVGTGLALLFSYYIYKKRFANGVFKIFLFLPQIISAIALVTIFKYFADYAFPTMMKGVGVTVPPLLSDKKTRFATVIFYNVWASFGPGVLLYSGAMANISDSVTEAARIDGAGPVVEFTRIVFPMIFPTFKTFVITGVASIFISDISLYAFYSGGAERDMWTFGYYMLSKVRNASLSDYPYLASIGIILTLFAVPFSFGVRALLDRIGPRTE